jgi:hypothetical protein
MLVGLCLGMAAALSARAAAGGDDYQPDMPFTRLFDTGAASARPLVPRAIEAKTGWTLVPEDDLSHRFSGDVVLLNDKLAIVLRPDGTGAEVYSQADAAMKQRVVITSLDAAGNPTSGPSAILTVENGPGAVMVEATAETTDGKRCSVTYRLTAGERTLEVRGGQRAGRMMVRGKMRYVIVPDFFGDDMVFGPDAFDGSRLGLPTENFLLGLLGCDPEQTGGGNAMVMCVWKSGKQGAEAILSDRRPQRAVAGCEIECAKDESLWVALLEGTDIWQRRAIPDEDANEEMALDWQPPFAAKWRADWAQADGVARSWDFGGQQLPAAAKKALNSEESAGELVVYPIDRSRATPLTALTPIDVVRNTLGVGPCQYILQTEGLTSETNPTPDHVMNWIEKRFKGRKEKQSAEQIKEKLKRMTGHVRHVQARINEYSRFARQVRALIAVEGQNEDLSEAVETFGRTLDHLEQTIAQGRGTAEPAVRTALLSKEIIGLIGNENSLDECRQIGASIRRIGAVQDRTLSKCRMAARWLKQQARMRAAAGSPGAELARDVQDKVERFLQGS